MSALNESKLLARVARARNATKSRVTYVLGKGGFVPSSANPGQYNKSKGRYECDCSGFVAWVLGLSRVPKRSRPFWIETTAVYKDSMGKQSTFVSIGKPVPGALVVYPDRMGRQGHIGVITAVNGSEIIGVDCSSGQSRRTGQAITERNLGFFLAKKPAFVVLREDLK